jgi:hypothetical protein
MLADRQWRRRVRCRYPSREVMIFFIHIPKAAGTTLRKALERSVRDRLVPAYPDNEALSLEKAVARASSLRSDSIIFGHFSWGLHERFRRTPRYACILRNPVDRVISWYRWQGTHQHLRYHRQVRMGLPLESMLPVESSDLSNGMVRKLAGRDPEALDDKETLEIAKANLRACEFVGLAEFLHLDVGRLNRALGSTISELPRENVATYSVTVSQATRDTIRAHNRLDLELYDVARRLVAARNARIWSALAST